MVKDVIKHAFYVGRSKAMDFSIVIKASASKDAVVLFSALNLYSDDLDFMFFMNLESVVFAYLDAAGEDYTADVDVDAYTLHLTIAFL